MRTLLLLLLAVSLRAEVRLEGAWRMTGQDAQSHRLPEATDAAWEEVRLPWAARPRNGVFWLRKTIELEAPMPEAVLVLGRVASSFEVYVNGQHLGGPPGFGSSDVELWQPRQFRVPGGLSAGRVTIALRCWETKAWWPGLFSDAGPYRMATAAEAQAALDRFWLKSRNFVYLRLLISAAQVALGLYLILVWRRDIFWLGFFLAAWGGIWCFQCHLSGYESHLRSGWYTAISVLNSLGWVAWCLATLEFLSFPPRAARWLIPPMAAILLGHNAIAADAPSWFDIDSTVAIVLIPQAFAICLAAIRLRDATHRSQALLIFIAGLTSVYANSRSLLIGTSAAGQLAWQGFVIPMTPLAYLVLSVWMSIEYMERLKRQRAERERLAAEMESARGVQASLLSTSTLESGGYRADAVYLPALEVGGDFYELIEVSGGSLLVVVGDVSGKGLQAAMVVALALGALRNRHSSSPAELLAEMNRSLVRRNAGGFVTCVIARLEPDGRMVAASAGHPAPYVDERELTVNPGLPLGLVEDASYEEISGHADASLTLVSDGVVEAANLQGELFGFERTRETSGKPAAEIAEAARQWGQNDDITVVTVRRLA